MRPFFSYYGSKWYGARKYGAPERDIVVEPFCGSAGYSVFWEPRHCVLVDSNQDICALWEYLIKCSIAEISHLPTDRSLNDISSLPVCYEAKVLIGFWCGKGRVRPAKSASAWQREFVNSTSVRVWGDSVKKRIIQQKHKIEKWKIVCGGFEEAPVMDAHYHIDPPYNNSAGKKYVNKFDQYEALSTWIYTLPGRVDVCENVGADWLPFKPLYRVKATNGVGRFKYSEEAVFSRGLHRDAAALI